MRITEKSRNKPNCVAVFRNILKIEFLSPLAISYHLVLYIEVSGTYNNCTQSLVHKQSSVLHKSQAH